MKFVPHVDRGASTCTWEAVSDDGQDSIWFPVYDLISPETIVRYSDYPDEAILQRHKGKYRLNIGQHDDPNFVGPVFSTLEEIQQYVALRHAAGVGHKE